MVKSLLATMAVVAPLTTALVAYDLVGKTEPAYEALSREEIQNIKPRNVWPRIPTAVEIYMLQDIVNDSGLTPDSTIQRVYFEIAQFYLYNTMAYDNAELDTRSIGESFRVNHQKRRGVCIDFASAAAALVSDEGFPPLVLFMAGNAGRHAVFLYRSEYGYGCFGNTPSLPIHRTIEDLVRSLGDFNRFNVVNLDDNYPNKEWIHGNVDLQDLNDAGYIRIGSRK